MAENHSREELETLAAEAAKNGVDPTEATRILNDYAAALAQEFKEKTESAPENVELHTRQFFKDNVATAAAQIVWLSNNAESETVKLNASKTIVQAALQVEKEDQDPVAGIIAGLKANDKKPQPVSKED